MVLADAFTRHPYATYLEFVIKGYDISCGSGRYAAKVRALQEIGRNGGS